MCSGVCPYSTVMQSTSVTGPSVYWRSFWASASRVSASWARASSESEEAARQMDKIIVLVIFSSPVVIVEACRRLAQAHLTRPGLTDIDRCPVQNLGTARLPNLDRMRHTDFRKNTNSLISSCKTENSTTSLLSRLWCHLSTIMLFVGRTL